MAVATYTASEVNALKCHVGGINVVRSRFVAPTVQAGGVAAVTTLSVSDVILLLRLPHGATLIDWKIQGGIIGCTSSVWSLGFQGNVVDAISGKSHSTGTLAAGISLTEGGCWQAFNPVFPSASASLSGSLVNAPLWSSMPAALPLKISLSDDATPRWVWIQALPGGSSTTGTCSLNFTAFYTTGE